MRKARLRSYNDYRASYGLRRMRCYDELTSDAAVRERLVELYGPDIDDLEWYVGIFAEEYPDYLMMGDLLMTMVANDAFTQALTNPLLARNASSAPTPSLPPGWRSSTTPQSLAQIVRRNATRTRTRCWPASPVRRRNVLGARNRDPLHREPLTRLDLPARPDHGSVPVAVHKE